MAKRLQVSLNNDVGMLSEAKHNAKPATEEAHTFNIAASDTNLNIKLTVGGSSPSKNKKVNFCLFMLLFDLKIPNI
jgi:hypothetical protein